MGCTESKEAVAAKSATSADNASTAARAKARAEARAAAAANPTAASTAVSAVASTVSAAGATTYKAFRDPSVALRNIVDTSKTVGAKVSEKAATQAHHVRNVFATPIDVQDFKSYKPPVHKKSIASTKFIVAALQHNFVFEQLSEKELFPLVQAFESIVVPSAEVIIKQGDGGDYFYIIETGQCAFEVDGKEVGRASKGNSFGELALLYTCPRAATVTALVETTLYRVDQKTFRFILQNQTEQGSSQKGELLAGVDFLKDLEAADIAKLASVMTPKRFSTGDYLIHKGDAADYFYLVAEGTLTVCDIGIGDAKYEDVILKVGDYVGERALVTGDPRAANVVAKTDGMAFSVDKETFDTVLGQLSVLILRSQDKVKLAGIKCIKDTLLDTQTLSSLTKLIVDQKFMSGTDICKQGESTVAALYLVREGKVTITDKEGNHKEVIEVGGYFGDDQLLADASGDLKHANGSMNVVVKYTATVTEDCTCGVLTLQECTKIIDTKDIGVGKMARTDSMKIEKIALESLKRHSMLGAGTFGQVWLVSRVAADGKPVAYALKIQSKYELCQDGQAKAVINEKGIMSQLHHPFITNLVASYQDPGYVYMLMGMVQGGELYSIIHTRRRDGVKEESAKFYAAGIAEGLAYMHRRGFIYRDLKPENVMLDAEGYPVIVDFGFAKYLTDKTYTLCGTPLYLPPEVILNRGHTFSADHWSLGVLTYEMITGFTPFYFDGMEQMDLFRAIVKGVYEKPRSIHPVAASLIDGFLTKIPAKRLGSLAGGEEGVYNHPWFKSIDFDALRNKKIKAPHVPKIKDPLDASNFEDWSHLEDKTKAGFPKLKPSQEKLFKAF